MRNLLALFGAALVVFVGLGWYLDWYHVTPTSGAKAGHNSIQIDLNAKKIGEDVEHGVEAGTEKVHDLLDGVKKPATPAATLPTSGRPR